MSYVKSSLPFPSQFAIEFNFEIISHKLLLNEWYFYPQKKILPFFFWSFYSSVSLCSAYTIANILFFANFSI